MKIMNLNSFKEAKDIFQYPKFSVAIVHVSNYKSDSSVKHSYFSSNFYSVEMASYK